jgi:hypothetical protein
LLSTNQDFFYHSVGAYKEHNEFMVMAPKVVTTVSTAEQQRAPVVHNELYSHVRPMLPQDEPIMDHWSAILICGGYNCNNLKYHNHESIVVFVGTKDMMKTYFVIQ